MPNLPLWSPRFQYDDVNSELQYKPFPSYPSWLVAWALPAIGGSITVPKHANIDPHQWQFTQGTQAFTKTDASNVTSAIMTFAGDGENVMKTTLLLQPHEIGTYQMFVSAVAFQFAPIVEIYINSTLVHTEDLYADPENADYLFSFSFAGDVFDNPLIELWLSCTTKNASSSGFIASIGNVWIIPTDF